MFEDDEEEDEDLLEDDDYEYELSEIEEWFDNNFQYFKRESDAIVDLTDEITHFYENVFVPVTSELEPAIYKLMIQQYPLIRGESRPLVMEYINNTIKYVAHEFLMQICMVVLDLKEGVKFSEKYEKFQSWVEFYGRPAEKPVLNYDFFEEYPHLAVNFTQEMKDEFAVESLESETITYETEGKLMKEYYDVVQPIILKYYKELDDLNYEGWIMYAVQIREVYEDYKYYCEHLHTFIDYGFDEADIDLPYQEFSDKLGVRINERFDKEQAELEENQLDENP
jgi:hypothetical protein